jgi:hypothetical protein
LSKAQSKATDELAQQISIKQKSEETLIVLSRTNLEIVIDGLAEKLAQSSQVSWLS